MQSKQPKIRFKGFAGDWKKCSFKELYKFASEGGTPNTRQKVYYENGNIPFVKIEDTEEKYITQVKTFITQEKQLD